MKTGRDGCRWSPACVLPLRHVAWATLTLMIVAAPRSAAASDRSLTFFHTNTNESATVTYRRGDRYDEEGLNRLNWLLRDWRVNEPVKMDPRLFDILWELYRESGSREPIHVISAYRSPGTNTMLRQRSSAVSEHSQHMSGKAMDIRLPDVEPARLRAIAMRLQEGGVGYYGASGFVHVDTGSVRAWPRMSEEQLARLFPDGKTVHLPPSGKPLARYEEARAEIAARLGGMTSYAGLGSGPSLAGFLGRIFGGSAEPAAAPPAAPVQTAALEVKPISVPLPPRRPQTVPVAAEPPASPWLEAPAASMQPEMDWPAPEDVRATVRALFVPGGGARPAPRITLVQARSLPFDGGRQFGAFEPPVGVSGRFTRPAEGIEAARLTGPAVPAARVREAKAGS